MPKKRIGEIAIKFNTDIEEAVEIAKTKLPPEFVTGRGNNLWINEEGVELLSESFMIDEIIPRYFVGKVVMECPNDRYNYVYSKEIKKKVPVLIPNRLKGKMVGKTITFEAIESTTGISYRYAKKR